MAVVGEGHRSYLQIGREAVWGTKVAATRRMELIEAAIPPVPGFVRDPSLNSQRSRRGLYPVGQFWRGTIRVRVNYLGGLLTLLDGVFGTNTFGAKGAVTTGPATGVYTHKFTEKQTLNSYTIELGEGDIPTGKVQVLTGAKIKGMRLAVEAAQGEAGMMTAEFQVIAKTKLDTQDPTTTFVRNGDTHSSTLLDGLANISNIYVGQPLTGSGIPVGTTVAAIAGPTSVTMSAAATTTLSATAITFTLVPATLNPVLFTQANIIDDGISTSGIVVKAAEFAIDAPTTEGERLGLGSGLINEPVPNDFMVPTARFREEFVNVGLLQAVAAGTIGSPELRFANVHTFRVRMSEAEITSGGDAPIRGYGILENDVTWEGYRSGTNADASAMYVEITNTEDGTDI